MNNIIIICDNGEIIERLPTQWEIDDQGNWTDLPMFLKPQAA